LVNVVVGEGGGGGKFSRFLSPCKIISNFSLTLSPKEFSKGQLYYVFSLFSLVMKPKRKPQPQRAHLCRSRLHLRIMKRNW